MELILGDLSDLLASGASHKALNGLKFGESAPFMLFDSHKIFQFTQITLSLSNDHLSLLMIIITLMMIEGPE